MQKFVLEAETINNAWSLLVVFVDITQWLKHRSEIQKESYSVINVRLIVLIDTSGGSLCGVMANMLHSCFKVSKFELQSGYSVHFQINTLGKGIEPPLISLAMG